METPKFRATPSSMAVATKASAHEYGKSTKGNGGAAQSVIDEHLSHPTFWSRFLTYPQVERFLRKSLSTKASRDFSFAQCIVDSDPTLDGRPLMGQISTTLSLGGPKLESETPPANHQRCCSLGGSDGQIGASSQSADGASGNLSSAAAQTSPFLLTREGSASSAWSWRTGSTKRNLSTEFDDSIWSPKRRFPSGGTSSDPPRKKLRFGNVQRDALPIVKATFFAALPAELSAYALSFLVFSEKVQIAVVQAGARGVLAIGSAWDPLTLDQRSCGALLRHLRRLDPFGCFPAEIECAKARLPAGLFKVSELRVDLMDPDHGITCESDTEDEALKPLSQFAASTYVLDPLDEVCKRLRTYFPCVRSLQISNIEDHRMDYRFATLRPGVFAEFPFVCLTHQATAPPTYFLHAMKNAEPPRVDVVELLKENRERVPMGDQIGMHFDDSTWISPAEALFLMEHPAAFKSSDRFHFTHTPWRTIPSHVVRKHYNGLVADFKRQARSPLQCLHP